MTQVAPGHLSANQSALNPCCTRVYVEGAPYLLGGGLQNTIQVERVSNCGREPVDCNLAFSLLLQQSSDEIDKRLWAIANAQGKPLDPQLSHALIFYTSGEIVAGLVPGHVPYAVKNGLWNQGGLGVFKPLLDQYWRPYIRGSGTFEKSDGSGAFTSTDRNR